MTNSWDGEALVEKLITVIIWKPKLISSKRYGLIAIDILTDRAIKQCPQSIFRWHSAFIEKWIFLDIKYPYQ